MASKQYHIDVDKLPRLRRVRGGGATAQIIVRCTPQEREAVNALAFKARWDTSGMIRGMLQAALAAEGVIFGDLGPRVDPRQLALLPDGPGDMPQDRPHAPAEPSPRGKRTKQPRTKPAPEAKAAKRVRKSKPAPKKPSRSRRAGRKS